MPFEYYQRLPKAERAVYRQSDAVAALPLPDASALWPAVEALRAALEAGDGAAVAEASFTVSRGVARALGARPPALEIHAVRPRGETHELHGLYEPEGEAGGGRPVITVWMRTARHGRVVAFRTFLRTLLHELVHHLDYEVLGLAVSFHTEGFFKRESSLFRQLVPGPGTAQAPGAAGAHRRPMANENKRAKPDDVGGEASARQQRVRQAREIGPDVSTDDALPPGAPRSRPPGTGEAGELGEPDAGVPRETPDEE